VQIPGCTGAWSQAKITNGYGLFWCWRCIKENGQCRQAGAIIKRLYVWVNNLLFSEPDVITVEMALKKCLFPIIGAYL
jgi:hypothetical protein